MPSSVKLLWVSGEGEVMVWRSVGQGSDSRRVHMSLGGHCGRERSVEEGQLLHVSRDSSH